MPQLNLFARHYEPAARPPAQPADANPYKAGTHKFYLWDKLKQGPATSRELNAICFRYSARIMEMRRDGYNITSRDLGDGLWIWTMEG